MRCHVRMYDGAVSRRHWDREPGRYLEGITRSRAEDAGINGSLERK
jgi:hypothetical protein